MGGHRYGTSFSEIHFFILPEMSQSSKRLEVVPAVIHSIWFHPHISLFTCIWFRDIIHVNKVAVLVNKVAVLLNHIICLHL